MSPPSLVTIDASEPLEIINEIIARDGGVIVSNFLPGEVLKKAMEDGKPFLFFHFTPYSTTEET